MPVMIRVAAVAAIVAVFCMAAASAEDFFNSNSGITHTLYTDSVVHENAILAYRNLLVANSLNLKNYGVVSGGVSVCAGCQVNLVNAGEIAGIVTIGMNATLNQIVGGPSDLNAVAVARNDASSRFFVMADGAKHVNFMDLANLARGADALILKDSGINFNLGDRASVPVQLSGKVMFYINNVPDANNIVLLKNVSGDGTLTVVTDTPNLFYAETAMDGTNVILNINRETDYMKIIGGPKGAFINQIRTSGIAARLIASLDGARSAAQLDAIMNRSVMLNPNNLMRPVKAMTGAMMSNAMMSRGASSAGAAGTAAAIFGRDTFLYYGGIGAELPFGDFRFGASVTAAGFSTNGLEDFGGRIYGGNVTAAFDRKWFTARAMAGVGFASFETGPIYNGTSGAIYNPNGTIYYGATDIGVRVYDVGSPKEGELYVVPFARANAMTTRVLNDFESAAAIGAGTRIGYATEMMGIMTDYSAYGVLMTDGEQAGLRMDVDLPMDGAGFGVRVAMLNTGIGRFYEIGAEGKVVF
ncbi:MAG: hypothetical protein FWC51_00945 [Proteobacteria bacterium]|nr:hypothetical protein [Pseudomonadota bacterium]